MRQPTKSSCHPDLEHHAKGLCSSCYKKMQYNSDPEAAKQKHYQWTQLNKEHIKEYSNKRKEADEIKNTFNEIKQRARKKNIQFDITIEYLRSIWTNDCPILGISMQFNKGRQENSFSVDRIDNTQGYINGNIIVISWRANRIKRDATIEELNKLVEYFKKLTNKGQ
jgi:hypothetical protein